MSENREQAGGEGGPLCDTLSQRGLRHTQVVTCSASGENQARALGADAITQEEQTVKGLRRVPCAQPTLKRRTEEMTEEGRGTQQPLILRKEGLDLGSRGRNVSNGHLRKTGTGKQSGQAFPSPFQLPPRMTSFFHEYTAFPNLPQTVCL